MSSFGILGDRRFVSVNVIVTTTTKSVEEKILGVTLNKDLNFKNHLNKLCKKLDKSCMHWHAFQTM